MGFDSYQQEVAFRAIRGKYCAYCARRQYGLRVFCVTCEEKLSLGVTKGLKNKASFVWAYYKAIDELRALEESKQKSENKDIEF